jgi:hypothetical protein
MKVRKALKAKKAAKASPSSSSSQPKPDESKMKGMKGNMKKPAAAGWKGFATEDPDTSPVTSQQRHVWKKSFDKLPKDIQQKYTETRGSGKTGAVKEATTSLSSTYKL